MQHLDGTRGSKKTVPSLISSRTTTKRSKTRNCFGSLFASPAGREKARDECYGDEEIEEDHSPMLIVSPRATDAVPVAVTPKMKRRSLSLKRRSKSTSGASMVTAPEENQLARASEQLTRPDHDHQSPMKMTGIGTPASPSRDAALTSHPITGSDAQGQHT